MSKTTIDRSMLRVCFVYDPDGRYTLHTPEGNPLPGSREEYGRNPFMKDGRELSYEDYAVYYGDPDRHIVVGAVLQRQCACCGAWQDAGSLWGIDFMDDSPEVATLAIMSHWTDRYTSYPVDSLDLVGYLREVVDELIAELA